MSHHARCPERVVRSTLNLESRHVEAAGLRARLRSLLSRKTLCEPPLLLRAVLGLFSPESYLIEASTPQSSATIAIASCRLSMSFLARHPEHGVVSPPLGFVILRPSLIELS